MTAADDEVRAPLMPRECDIREYGAATVQPDSSGSSTVSDSDSDVQDGVRRIEAVARTWSKWGLVVAYMRLVNSNHQGGRSTMPLTWRQHLPHGLHHFT